jgi:hypothetical protein
VKVGDLVRVTMPGDNYASRLGVIAAFESIHYGGMSYPKVLIDGKLLVFARKNLEVINENR